MVDHFEIEDMMGKIISEKREEFIELMLRDSEILNLLNDLIKTMKIKTLVTTIDIPINKTLMLIPSLHQAPCSVLIRTIRLGMVIRGGELSGLQITFDTSKGTYVVGMGKDISERSNLAFFLLNYSDVVALLSSVKTAIKIAIEKQVSSLKKIRDIYVVLRSVT